MSNVMSLQKQMADIAEVLPGSEIADIVEIDESTVSRLKNGRILRSEHEDSIDALHYLIRNLRRELTRDPELLRRAIRARQESLGGVSVVGLIREGRAQEALAALCPSVPPDASLSDEIAAIEERMGKLGATRSDTDDRLLALSEAAADLPESNPVLSDEEQNAADAIIEAGTPFFGASYRIREFPEEDSGDIFHVVLFETGAPLDEVADRMDAFLDAGGGDVVATNANLVGMAVV
jgi:hypothetical protein